MLIYRLGRNATSILRSQTDFATLFEHFLDCVLLMWYSTWKNAQLGEALVQKLEDNSKKIAEEKQAYLGE